MAITLVAVLYFLRHDMQYEQNIKLNNMVICKMWRRTGNSIANNIGWPWHLLNSELNIIYISNSCCKHFK